MPLDKPLEGGRLLVFRHPAVVRITHWVNLASLVILLLSGLQILCSHPAFYWGETARFAEPFAAIVSEMGDDGEPRGRLTAPGVDIDTTGLLGASRNADGLMTSRAIPHLLTLPGELDLGAGRRWHFFFAWALVINGLIYAAYAVASGRVTGLLWPSLADLRRFGGALWDHLRLRFAHDDPGYNVLQKLAYAAVIFGLLPLMLLTGLVMSPAVYARLPILGDLLGGRQSARTLHFLAASGLVAFVAVHLAMVLAAGPVNEIRSMITGWFVIRREEEKP